MEIESIKVVGIVNTFGPRNARISVVGYLDSNWIFNRLTQSMAAEMFPTQGKVFAPHLQDKRPDLVNKCIYIGVQRSNNDGKDNFIWDWNNGRAEVYCTSILDVKNVISNDVEHSYDKLKATYDNEGIGYIMSDDYVYKIDENINKYYISRWNFYDFINSNIDNFITLDSKRYFMIKDMVSLKPEYVDIMPNKILRYWITNGALTKNWLELINGGSPENLKIAITEVLKGIKGTPQAIIESRFNRFSNILDDFIFSYNKLKDLASSPIIVRLIESSVAANYQHFINEESCKYANEYNQFKQDNEQKILDLKESTQKKIAGIGGLLDNAKNESEKIKAKLLKEENLLTNRIREQNLTINKNKILIEQQDVILKKLSENQEDIVKNFGIVKDVLTMFNGSALDKSLAQNGAMYSIRTIESENKEIESETSFILRLGHYLECNNRVSDISKKIFGLLVGYNVLLLPDEKIVVSLLNAIGWCKYSVFNVTPDVCSFVDVWNHGLADIVRLSLEEPSELHFFVMQNINTSYIACYLQPVVNMVMGLENTFPGTDINFPKNLKILLTPTDEEGLPLAKQCISNFGCLTKIKYSVNECNEGRHYRMEPDNKGYLSSIQLMHIGENAPLISSDYESYLTSDEY